MRIKGVFLIVVLFGIVGAILFSTPASSVLQSEPVATDEDLNIVIKQLTLGEVLTDAQVSAVDFVEPVEKPVEKPVLTLSLTRDLIDEFGLHHPKTFEANLNAITLDLTDIEGTSAINAKMDIALAVSSNQSIEFNTISNTFDVYLDDVLIDSKSNTVHNTIVSADTNIMTFSIDMDDISAKLNPNSVGKLELKIRELYLIKDNTRYFANPNQVIYDSSIEKKTNQTIILDENSNPVRVYDHDSRINVDLGAGFGGSVVCTSVFRSGGLICMAYGFEKSNYYFPTIGKITATSNDGEVLTLQPVKSRTVGGTVGGSGAGGSCRANIADGYVCDEDLNSPARFTTALRQNTEYVISVESSGTTPQHVKPVKFTITVPQYEPTEFAFSCKVDNYESNKQSPTPVSCNFPN